MSFRPGEKGQAMVEKALLIALVSIVVIAVLWLFGPQLILAYQNIIQAIT